MSYRRTDSRDSSRYSSSSRRESPPSRRHDRRSPGPSRGRSPEPVKERPDDELPESFGRGQDERRDDDGSVLFRMKSGYKGSPLSCIAKCVDGSRRIKVWTRNYKEVRGICTGYVVAFDKHWNLVMSDVDEVYLKPKKAKTPYLCDVGSDDNLPELPAKVPRKKKSPAEKQAESEEATASDAATPEATVVVKIEGEKKDGKDGEKKDGKEGEKKKRKKKKKKTSKNGNRHLRQVFIRGDNVVMVAILDDE